MASDARGVDHPSAVLAAALLTSICLLPLMLIPYLVGAAARDFAVAPHQLGFVASGIIGGVIAVMASSGLWVRKFNWRMLVVVGACITVAGYLLAGHVSGFGAMGILLFIANCGSGLVYAPAIGGEHTCTYPGLKALTRDGEEPLALTHLDAHADTASNFGGTRVSDASLFQVAAVDGYIDPEKTIQIGLRGRGVPRADFSIDSGMTIVHAEAFQARALNQWSRRFTRSLVTIGPTRRWTQMCSTACACQEQRYPSLLGSLEEKCGT